MAEIIDYEEFNRRRRAVETVTDQSRRTKNILLRLLSGEAKTADPAIIAAFERGARDGKQRSRYCEVLPGYCKTDYAWGYFSGALSARFHLPVDWERVFIDFGSAGDPPAFGGAHRPRRLATKIRNTIILMEIGFDHSDTVSDTARIADIAEKFGFSDERRVWQILQGDDHVAFSAAWIKTTPH